MARRLEGLIKARLPHSNTRAFWAVALFAAVQCADAVQTILGIERFGPSIEANPILSFYFSSFGPYATLIGAKSIAIVAAFALYLYARYLAIVLLTIAVVFTALVPWAFVLSLS